jgi:polar amino acid transport system substrate-binding protein
LDDHYSVYKKVRAWFYEGVLFMHKRLAIVPLILVVTTVLVAACGGGTTPTPAPPADKLGEIMERGRLIISTDLDYPPQSELKPGASRAANTQCASTEYTASELAGFDVDVAVEIAERLGVEPCFVTAPWTQITGGSWGDHWDISVGSMAITPERMEVLYFTQPYYTTPAALFVHKDNTAFTQPEQLSGKKIGVCAGCTYEYFLDGSLLIPGQTIDFVVEDAIIIGYDTEIPSLEDLALGDGLQLDAVLTGVPLGQSLIADGLPIKQLDGPIFTEYLAVAVDRSSTKDPIVLTRRITEIIQGMHQDGTLLGLSQTYYGDDFTTAASQFDIQALSQLP